jgi:hypothetical protein
VHGLQTAVPPGQGLAAACLLSRSGTAVVQCDGWHMHCTRYSSTPTFVTTKFPLGLLIVSVVCSSTKCESGRSQPEADVRWQAMPSIEARMGSLHCV